MQGQININILYKNEEKTFKFDDTDSLQYVTNYIAFELGLLKINSDVSDVLLKLRFGFYVGFCYYQKP